MFCPNCGTDMEENAAFCPNCGTPNTPAAAEPEAPVATAPAKKCNKKLFALIGAAVAAVLVIVALFSAFFGPKAAANKYMKAMYKTGNAKVVVNSIPKKILNEILDEHDKDKKDLIEDLEDGLADRVDEYKEEYDSFKYKVLYTYSYTKDQVEDFEDELNERYDVDLKVSAVKVIGYKISTNDDGEKANYSTSMIVYKVGMKWYPQSALNYV